MTKPIRLFLVRHGNTFESGQTPTQIGSRTDLPLTEHGRQQAAHCAQYFTQFPPPRALYAGTLKRQVETATIIADALYIPERLHIGENALTEIDYGAWEGLTTEEISSRWPLEYAEWTTAGIWPQAIFGGTLQGHIRAITHWLDSLRTQYSSDDIVVGVTSNGTVRLFYTFLEQEWKRLQDEKQVALLKVKTGHFCELALYETTLEVKSWNIHP